MIWISARRPAPLGLCQGCIRNHSRENRIAANSYIITHHFIEDWWCKYSAMNHVITGSGSGVLLYQCNTFSNANTGKPTGKCWDKFESKHVPIVLKKPYLSNVSGHVIIKILSMTFAFFMVFFTVIQPTIALSIRLYCQAVAIKNSFSWKVQSESAYEFNGWYNISTSTCSHFCKERNFYKPLIYELTPHVQLLFLHNDLSCKTVDMNFIVLMHVVTFFRFLGMRDGCIASSPYLLLWHFWCSTRYVYWFSA